MIRGTYVKLTADAVDKLVDPRHDHDTGQVVLLDGVLVTVRWNNIGSGEYHEVWLEALPRVEPYPCRQHEPLKVKGIPSPRTRKFAKVARSQKAGIVPKIKNS